MVARLRGLRVLSDAQVRQSRGPAQLHDGGGLYVEVDERENKRWVLRLTIDGKRTRRGLGSYPIVGLAQARLEADRIKRGDGEASYPAPTRPPATTPTITFRAYFKRHFDIAIRPTLNPKFAVSYYRSVEQLLFPALGDRPIAEIRAQEVIDALRPCWRTTPERARRALQRASVAFESAIVNEVRVHGDPTIGVRRELGRGRPRVTHRPSLPWQDAPAFLQWLRDRPRLTPSCRLALMMIVFTGLRSEEVRLAKWGEVDLDTREWRIPGLDELETKRLGFEGYKKKRMKTGLAHVVPLSTGAISVLAEARACRQDVAPQDLVFPSTRSTPLSDNALSKLLRDGGYGGLASPHGFRSTLKTWCAEHGVRDEVSECILAHGDPDLVRKAYRHATYLEERRAVLQRWSDYLGYAHAQGCSSPVLAST